MLLSRIIQTDMVENKRLLDRLTVIAFRINQAANRGRCRLPKRFVAKFIDAAWLQLVIGSDLPGRAQCGPSLRMPHGGRGIALHPNARIGSNVTIYHQVTIGGYGPDKHNVPTIGDGVYIGVGAKIIGRVVIGDNARIGAGAVVTQDVPSGATAVGNPAIISEPRVPLISGG